MPYFVSPLPLLAVTTFALLAGASASASVIFSQDFNTGSMAATGTPGSTYTNGTPVWRVTDDNTAATSVQWAAGTAATGWTANASAGYVAGNTATSTQSTYFIAQGWNTNSAPIIQIDLKFTVTAKSGVGGLGNWGALVLSNSTFTDITVPVATAQVGHLRFGVDASGANIASTIRNASNTAFTNSATGQYNVGVGEINTLSIIYNGSASTFSGIDTNRADIFLNGNSIGPNVSIANTYAGGAVPLNYLELRAFSSLGTTQAFFDDITVTAIPEPSAFAALFGAAALGFVAARRRRSVR